MDILLIVLGFGLLIKGADWMVSGASALGKQYGLSELAIGLTVVAFGTSAPELVVNSVAALDQHSSIVFGNVIGSNNFNLFVILGIVGLIQPIAVQESTVWKEIPISMAAVLLVLLLVNGWGFREDHLLSSGDGAILFFCFLLFLGYVYRQLKWTVPETETPSISLSGVQIWGLILIGLAALIIGGKLVVDNAVELAAQFGVSQHIIGLTIVAAGTSLPELVTSVVAALKKNSDIAIGNIVGSNIFNLLLVLPVSAFVHPVAYDPVLNTDLFFLLGGTIFVFVAMFSGTKKKLDRWEAGLLLAAFFGYTVYLIVQAGQ